MLVLLPLEIQTGLVKGRKKSKPCWFESVSVVYCQIRTVQRESLSGQFYQTLKISKNQKCLTFEAERFFFF